MVKALLNGVGIQSISGTAGLDSKPRGKIRSFAKLFHEPEHHDPFLDAQMHHSLQMGQ